MGHGRGHRTASLSHETGILWDNGGMDGMVSGGMLEEQSMTTVEPESWGMMILSDVAGTWH